MKRLLFSSALAAGLVAAGATFSGAVRASDDSSKDNCNVPAAEHQPMDALKQKLEAEGWKVMRIKTDDGCYEVHATNPKGQQVEAYFNPQTFDLVKSEMDD